MAVMKRIDVAFYEHTACDAKFFVQVRRVGEDNFKGKCPNPTCGRHIVLRPGELYVSTDRARRKYIKLSRRLKDKIFWQTRIT
jgi:hypothetical protein